MSSHAPLLDFLLEQVDHAWTYVRDEFDKLPEDAIQWQPAPHIHSIGWHLRHAFEWRYLLSHVWLSGHPCEEKLYCLGWESAPEVQKVAADPGKWFEPRFTRAELLQFAERSYRIARADLAAFPPDRYTEQRTFSWGTTRLIDELFEEGVRHPALHLGHVLELKKLWAARSQGGSR
jgi:DinB family protein